MYKHNLHNLNCFSLHAANVLLTYSFLYSSSAIPRAFSFRVYLTIRVYKFLDQKPSRRSSNMPWSCARKTLNCCHRLTVTLWLLCTIDFNTCTLGINSGIHKTFSFDDLLPLPRKNRPWNAARRFPRILSSTSTASLEWTNDTITHDHLNDAGPPRWHVYEVRSTSHWRRHSWRHTPTMTVSYWYTIWPGNSHFHRFSIRFGCRERKCVVARRRWQRRIPEGLRRQHKSDVLSLSLDQSSSWSTISSCVADRPMASLICILCIKVMMMMMMMRMMMMMMMMLVVGVLNFSFTAKGWITVKVYE